MSTLPPTLEDDLAGGFFASVLERLRRRLAELGARRYVDEDGYEYWELKPDWKPGDVVRL